MAQAQIAMKIQFNRFAPNHDFNSNARIASRGMNKKSTNNHWIASKNAPIVEQVLILHPQKYKISA